MKKIKEYWIVFAFIILVFLWLGLQIGTVIIWSTVSWKDYYGAYIRYGGSDFSSNGNYNGIIDTQEERVSILDQSQKEVSRIDIKEDYPGQIVLGENSYFLLYHQDNESGDAKIVQYDYQSVKKQEYMALDTDFIDYKDGYLFTGNYHELEDDTEEYLPFCNYVFYANNYIKEEDFGEELKPLKQDSSGKCTIGDIELYYHEEGYFSTEPLMSDYPLVSEGSMDTSDKDYYVETKQEKKNRELIISEIGRNKEIFLFEYQATNDVYGICNVFKKDKYLRVYPIEPEDIESSYFYKINPEKNELTILFQKDSCIGLTLSENEAVYQENNKIMHYNFQTGEEKEIYQINNEHDMRVYVKKDCLMIVEEKKRILPSVFPTDKRVISVVDWRLLSE